MPEVGEIIRSEKTGRLGRFLGEGRVELLSPGQEVTSPKTGRVGKVTSDNRIELIQEEQEKPGFTGRLSKDTIRRGQIAFEALSAQKQGEQTWGETLIQLAGQGAGLVMDTVWNGMVTAATGAGKGISAVTPDIIEEPVKDFASYSAHYMLNAAAKTGAIAALEDGVEAYQGWKEKNPRSARNLEATVNLGLFFAPLKSKGASTSGAGQSVNMTQRPSILSRAAQTIDDSIPKRNERLKREFVEDLMRPVESKRNMMKAIQDRKIGAGGLFTDKQYNFSAIEKSAIEDLVSSPKVARGKTVQNIWYAAREKVDDLERQLQQVVGGSRKRYDKQRFIVELDQLKNSTLNDNSALIIGENSRAVGNMFDYAKKIARKHDNTPGGVLRARREFDKWAKSQVSEKALYDPDTLDTAKSLANRVIREQFDGKLQGMVSEAKPLLTRQSGLLRATGNAPDAVLSVKAAAEPMSAISRQWQKVTQVLGMRSEFNNTMASLFGVGGLGAAALFAPFYTAGMGSYLAAKYVGGNLVFSKPTKKILSTLLRGTDSALKAVSRTPSTPAEIITSLKADRAVIQQFLDEGLFEQ